ncbi:MAG: C25 family cysteine peptidase, partial [bacterium]
ALYQRGFRLNLVDDAGTAAADLFTKSDVPCEIVGDSNGVFDGSDAIRLWGRSFRDQWMTSGWEHEDRFTQDNVVWLRIDPSGGTRFAPVRETGSLSGAPGDSLASTPSTWFREWDRKFYRRPPDFGPGRRAFESEFFFANDSRDATDGTTGWKLMGQAGGPETFEVVDLLPGSAGSVTVRVLGGGRPVDSVYRTRFEVNVNSHDPLIGEREFENASLYVGENVPPDRVLTTFPVPSGALVEGSNEFQFTGWSYRFGTLFPSTRFFFDWYEVTWERRLVARDGRVLLTTANGGAGNQIVRAEGFDAPDLALYDVTDPAHPRRVGLALDGSQVVDLGGTFDLRFDHDNAMGPGEYVVVRTSGVPELPAEQVTRRPATGVLAGGVGAQYVVATHAAFLSGSEEIATYRAGRYSTHVAELEEIWDVFGNGQRAPRALKSFATYAFHRWTTPIEYLLLVGDGNEDTRGVTASSMPDFVPSHGLWASYEGAYDVSDQYYCEVTRGNPADPDGFDDLSDFHVGRLPVSDADELDWNVRRIRAYEEGGRELWRRRVLLHADDAFSGSLGGGVGEPYGFRSIENLFRESCESSAEFLRTNHADPIVPVDLFLANWTQTCPDSCYKTSPPPLPECEESLGRDCGFWYDCRDFSNWVEVYTCMKANTGPAVLAATQAEVDRGALLWNFQGHANRYWMTHEEVFRDDEIGSRHDVATLTNEGRPFIFLGWACHLGEYDTAEEANVRVDDCMSEKMLNDRQPGLTEPAGAVAVFSSSGFEFLTPNVEFNRVFFEEMFPADGQGSAPATLGEALTRSRLAYQTVYPVDGNVRQAAQRFLLFGDPALEATLGTSPIHVTANGAEARDGETIALHDVGEPVEIVARTVPGSGAVALKIIDSQRGEIPADAVRVTGSDPLELVHRAAVRPEGVDFTVVAVDASGRETSFSLGLRADFRLDALAVFPNPFSDRASFYYRAAGAETATLHVYTINGRKIREITEAATGEGAVAWDGRDEDGEIVANGTYLARFVIHGASGTLERTTQVVRMR